MRKKILFLILSLNVVFSAKSQTGTTKPTNTTIISLSGTSSAWARSGGDVFTVRNPSWSTYKNCIYYGYPTTLVGVISGNCGAMQNLSYNSGSSNLSNGLLIYNGSTTYNWLVGTYTLNVRLTINVTDTLGNPLTLINTGSLNLLKITQNFKVKYQLETENPFTGYSYLGSINVYDYPNSSLGTNICTSFDHGDKFYSVTTTAIAGNGGPYCIGDTIKLTSSGGLNPTSYLWKMTGSPTVYPNASNISFPSVGASNKRMKVEVTGNSGCKDSAITIIKMLDTAVEIDLRGNFIPIPSGSIITSTTNFTDMGITPVGLLSSKTFKIHNTGNQPLKVSNITATSPFYISSIILPKTINGHDSATFNIDFNPLVAGIFSSTIKVYNNDCSESLYTFVVKGVGGNCDTTREIDIRGNFKPIVSGSLTPLLTNFTDFGNIIENAIVSRSFKVFNTRTTNLTLNSQSITGGDFALFSFTGITFPLTLVSGDSATFTITCSPLSLGVKTTTVNINSDDCDESNYNFAIKATDICDVLREINTTGNGISIPKGTITTSTINNTDFGSTTLGGSLSNTFFIQNTGTSSLKINSIILSGTDASMFTLSGISLPTSIPAGGSTTFIVTFLPITTGVKNATVTINNNDCDEGSYDFALSGSSSSVVPIKIPKPTGTTFTPGNSDPRAWAMGSGNYYTIRNSAWKTYSECTYWGYHDTIPAVINGYNASSTCSGLSDMYFSSGASSLSGGKLVYTGNTNYYYLNNSSFFSLNSVPVRLTFKITDTLGNPLPLLRSGSISLLKVTKNFKVSLFLEAFAPSNAFGYGGGFYVGAIDLFNNLHTDPTSLICTSIDLDQFYSVTTKASASNSGPYCASSVSIKSKGGISYSWTGPNSFIGSRNDTTFQAYGFPGLSRFKVEVTGILGCKDSAATIVTVKDTGTKIKIFGNSNLIINGSIVTSLANNTKFGSIPVGSPIVKTFTINNPGSAALQVKNITVTGTNPTMFVVSGISLPAAIGPSSFASLTVTFTPSSPGLKSAILNINNNSCNDTNYYFSIDGNTATCDSTHAPATSTGLHVSSIAETSLGGWTCYCDSAGKLLLSIKIGSSGAVIPTNGVQLKINSNNAIFYPNGVGFIGNTYGWSGLDRTWEVSPTTQPSSQLPVRFYFKNEDVDSINSTLVTNFLSPILNSDGMSFYKVTNGTKPAHAPVSNLAQSDVKVSMFGTSVTDSTWVKGSHTFGNYYAEFNVSSFSGGGGGAGPGGITPLPVELLKFAAVSLKNKIQLNWITVQEINSSYFEIERSENGKDFIALGRVNAAGYSYTQLSYSFTDINIKPSRNYFYRLNIVDRNSQHNYSNTILVKSFSNGFSNSDFITIYPNPANTELNLIWPEGIEKAEVIIHSIEGKTVLNQHIISFLPSVIDLKSLKAGIYTVSVNLNGVVTNQKLVIQK